ncbi:MAG: response regulator [candidate division Zixibacteria bacterium]|nr:response regulator [candidate division Zixibacteria bacterium]
MKILIIDDDREFIDHLRFILSESFDIESAVTCEEAIKIIYDRKVEAVLLDIDLGAGISGMDLLEKLREDAVDIPVIMISGTTSVDTVVKAMKMGADDYIGKTIKIEELKASIFRALTSAKNKRELNYLRSEIDQLKGEFWGDSEPIRKIREVIKIAAPNDSSVLISGESGTGKELVARSLHKYSKRSEGAFISVNCAAIPRELFESEFFGHEKGSFTGAIQKHIGKVELADGGTLFLDEIGELPWEMQSKFLRTLQDGSFQRIGSPKEMNSDFRLVSATNRELMQMVRDGSFREDLYYRVKVIEINVPPLRDRKVDIPLLAENILKKKCKQMNKRVPRITSSAMKALSAYNWYGNVRELENILECSLIFCKDDKLEAQDLQGINLTGMSDLPNYEVGKKEVINRYQKDYIRLSLKIYNGNISKTAESMGLSRQGLYNLINKFGIKTENGN